LGIPPRDPSPDAPTYDQLVALLSELQGVATTQAAEITALRAEVADLRERLDRNPRNSSVPPSAELFTKPASPSRADRRAAAKKHGK
jgi:hypothetical protein